MKSEILVSVVTVTYNAADAVERTINSIIPHLSDRVEYVMVDGGSTDGTQSVILKHRQHIDSFISERDRGIPDALNKAVKLSKGKYLIFILAGDLLNELPLKKLSESNADVICFPSTYTGNGKQYPEVNNWLKIKNTIPHQGAFFKRGPDLVHDERYRFFCDFDLCQRYYLAKKVMEVHRSPFVAFHGLDGATSDKKNFHEVFKIVRRNYGLVYQLLSYVYWKFDGLKNRLGIKKNGGD
ncbi:glycosyltransferase [Mucilaginibacter corticis]|nr:glycosyltransferase [Mucilaginibacter corticis]